MKANVGVEVWELSERECRSLLGSVTTGYLATSDRALPTVVPVRMRYLGDRVEVESLIGNSVPLRAGSVVALASGTFGQGQASEWIVEVRGFLGVVDGVVLDGVEAYPVARPFRLSIDVVSGWRRTLTSAEAHVELADAAASSSK